MKSKAPRATATAMQQFFETLEQRFGGVLPMDKGAAAEIIVSDSLQTSDLKRLFRHDATALHVRNFFPKESAIKLGAKLAQDVDDGKARNWKVSTAKGLESSDVFTLGEHVPYNVAVANNSIQEYHQQVSVELRQRRRDSATNEAKELWPLDQFRLELDQTWPHGAGLARSPGNSDLYMGGGLPRIMLGPTRWKRGFVHVDELAPLSISSGFFSANIYLQLPDTENASKPQDIFEIWPLGVRSKWDWYKVRNFKRKSTRKPSCTSKQSFTLRMQIRCQRCHHRMLKGNYYCGKHLGNLFALQLNLEISLCYASRGPMQPLDLPTKEQEYRFSVSSNTVEHMEDFILRVEARQTNETTTILLNLISRSVEICCA